MLYFFRRYSDRTVTATSEQHPAEFRTALGEWITRNDIHSFEYAERIAGEATRNAQLDGSSDRFIATDSGTNCWPRYDVIKAPAVGDVVSKGFNGDYYFVGTIIKIGKNDKQITVQTDTGAIETFRRRKLTGAWTDGTFALIPGRHEARNPHF